MQGTPRSRKPGRAHLRNRCMHTKGIAWGVGLLGLAFLAWAAFSGRGPRNVVNRAAPVHAPGATARSHEPPAADPGPLPTEATQRIEQLEKLLRELEERKSRL